MKTEPVVAAAIVFDAGAPPRSTDFGDVYHPVAGALAQARHVFLGGNGLPARWAGRDRFVVLELGFGLGNNFIATWAAWRADPARCERLVFVGLDKHPPTPDDLRRAHAGSPLPALADALVAAWPPLVPNLHPIDFDNGSVRLLLAFGDAARLLPELRLAADAIFLDGYAPAVNPALWQRPLLKGLRRIAAPGATAATWSVARPVRDGLVAAGFVTERAPGTGGKREITVARWQPRFVPARSAAPARRQAVVVGAGLAGSWTASALAAEGWDVTVLEREDAPAAAASGNPAGIFHGTVHGDDGPHARLLRAAALLAARCYAGRGQRGLLRLDGRGIDAMRALLRAQGLPPAYVQALDAAAASDIAGVGVSSAAWFFPDGGSVDPAAACRMALDSPRIRFCGGIDVARIEPHDGGWSLHDASGAGVAAAPVVVVANAGGAAELLGPHAASWPLQRQRGQLSGWSGAPAALRLPLAGDGYALPLPAGGLLFGATQNDGDDAAPRAADESSNLERLLRSTGLRPPSGAVLWSRVGWRLQSGDRLPIAGPVPLPATAGRKDQSRLWPRLDGLHVCTALGGRGITWAPLLGRLVAARIAGSPLPLEQGLVDAVDPARWLVRAARRG